MTRPPAPCSLAPGLPLSRRPAPRRTLAYLLVLLALLAADIATTVWFTLYISAGGPSPYADSWYMLAKFFYALVIAVAIVAIVCAWQIVIARVRCRREVL